MLTEKLDNIRGAVTMAYPMGLPTWDVVRLTIEGIEGLAGTSAANEMLDENTAELWIASRCLDRNQTIYERFGKNEKTKVIAKLQRPGAGAPAREAVVSEEEKKAMMAYYFKKQEEMKQIAENSEDDYLHSSWADSKQLQRSLRGTSTGIKAPGIR
jgi:cilia- and flagella-associated protein 298